MVKRFFACTAMALALASCATPSGGTAGAARGARAFVATAYEYNVNTSPQVHSRTFNCSVRFFGEGLVKIVEVRSFLSNGSAPDIIVRIVSSSNSVGSQIYNGKGEVIAEYPNGELVNDNLFTFTGGDPKRKVTGRWYIDPDYLMSDFTITDELGVQLYKETVIYQAKSPSRK